MPSASRDLLNPLPSGFPLLMQKLRSFCHSLFDDLRPHKAVEYDDYVRRNHSATVSSSAE